MYQKRGQVTVFVVIGLVILVSAFLIWYFTARQVTVQTPETLLRETPEQVKDVRLYVDECLQIVGKQAVVNLGEHGGWIYDESDPELIQKPFDVSFNPTDSEGVQLTNTGLKLPYWYYLKSDNDCRNCKFSLEFVPTKATMTEGINLYIEKKLQSCLKDFKPLLKKGYTIRKAGDTVADAKISPDAVTLDIKYPLEIKKDQKDYTLTDFTSVLPVKLGRTYDLAATLVNKEQSAGFLEYVTMMLVSSYATLDSSYFPPIAAATIGPSKMFWSKMNTENMLKDMLMQHTSMITVQGTHNFFPPAIDSSEKGYEVKQGISYGYVLNLLPESGQFPDVDARFYYLGWPIYFDINPSDGDLIGPNDIDSNLFNFLQVFSRQYEFAYAISYPVVVELRDVNAFNKQGFSFMFAMESNVRNNDALKPGDVIELSKLGETKLSLMGNALERISGSVKIKVRDDSTNVIKGASVRYTCGMDSVYIGTTNEQGEVVSKFPVCIGGTVSSSAEGYVRALKPLDTSFNQDAFAELIMPKIYKVNATVYVREKSAMDKAANMPYGSLTQEQLSQIVGGSERPLSDSETIYLSISKPKVEGETVFTRAYIFTNETRVNEIELTKGLNEITIQLVDMKGVYIPKQTIVANEKGDVVEEAFSSLLGEGTTKEFDIPAINITPAIRGGAMLDNATGYWFAQESDILSGKYVKFFAIQQPPPRIVTEMDRIGMSEELSRDMRSFIEPEWVKP
jgi:hypothetical protein